MDRFVRLAAATVLGNPYRPRHFTGIFIASSTPSASGHLGFVRARPDLLDLNSLLSPEAFLLDATHALGAAALRHQPMLGWVARTLRDLAPEIQAARRRRRGTSRACRLGVITWPSSTRRTAAF